MWTGQTYSGASVRRVTSRLQFTGNVHSGWLFRSAQTATHRRRPKELVLLHRRLVQVVLKKIQWLPTALVPYNMADMSSRAEYEAFDDLTLGVMQRNHAVLEIERDQAMKIHEETQPMSFRFDVVTSHSSTVREQHGAVCSLDLNEILKKCWTTKTHEKMPATNCYIEDVFIEEAINTFPCDLKLVCLQKDRIAGTFARGRVSGDDANHTTDMCLWVIHSGDRCTFPESGRRIYNAQDFVKGKTFRAYSKMLQNDFEDHTTKISGGKAVEYLSPNTVIRDDTVVKGDCFMDVMFLNSLAFRHSVVAIQTPLAGTDEGDSFSLRMHAEDFENLQSAVNQSVIGPLRQHILDLGCVPVLDFALIPDTTYKPQKEGIGASIASGAQNWRCPTLRSEDNNGAPCRASCKLRFNVRFV